MNEGLADGAGDFNVFSALNGDAANFQDIISSGIDDDATELNLVKAVASGKKINTSFAEENEAETTEGCLDAERRSEICQNVASAACASCAAAGDCPILKMRNFAQENLQPVAEEPKSYLSDLMNDDCDFVVAGYVSADNEEKASESIEKDSLSENKKTESVSEKPAVKSEVSDDDASMRVSAESNEANEPTDDECLNSESASSENIPSAKIIKENIQPKINEEPDETEAASQINLVDSEDIDEKVGIHKEYMPFENQAPAVDKESELPIKKDSRIGSFAMIDKERRDELSIKKDNHTGDENDINPAPILEDPIPRGNPVEKAISNELNSLPMRDFVQANNEIDVMKDDLGDCAKLSEEGARELEVVEHVSSHCTGAELNEEVTCKLKELSKEDARELEELPINKSEVIGQFTPNLKSAAVEIGQNNIVDEVVEKVAKKTELTEECSGSITADDCDEVKKCSVKIEESSNYCDDTDNVLKGENIPVFQEISTLPDGSLEGKASYNCDEGVVNNTNISGVYSGLWVDDSPLNPEDDKTSNISSSSSVLFQLIAALVGSLAVKIAIKRQEELCK